MRVLLTGGAGFVGSHLTELLLAEGHEVVSLDNIVTGSATNVAQFAPNPAFRFVHHDVTKPFECETAFDHILHLACPASPKDYDRLPIETLEVSSIGTQHMLNLAERHGASFLLASTSEVYGDPAVSPQPEEYWGNVNPVGPRSVYDEAKRYAEALTMAYRRSRGVDAKIMRIFNTYGPRMRASDGRAIPQFIDQALHGEPISIYGEGTQTRSFCFVGDLVRGIYALMNSELSGPVNLGNPVEMSILALAKKIIEVTGSDTRVVHEPLPQDDPRQRRPDITQAREKLGWEPRVSLDEGLSETVAWFRGSVAQEPKPATGVTARVAA